MLKYKVRTCSTASSSSCTLQRKRSTYFHPDQDISLESSSDGVCSELDDSLSPIVGPSRSSMRLRGRSSSVSSLSSAGSSCESSIEWGTLKVFTGSISDDTDYKTLFISTATTSRDLIRSLLTKFRIGNKDPNLFYICMILRTKKQGIEIENTLRLEQDAKPLELQSCHPKDMSRFVLQMADGTPVKIYDYCLAPECNYKSLLLSPRTTCAEAVNILLQSHRLPYPREHFVLVATNSRKDYEFVLPPETILLTVLRRQNMSDYQMHLRPLSQARISNNSTVQIVPSGLLDHVSPPMQ